MSDLWRVASEASDRFAAQALDYHRYRPRYPEGVFNDIVRLAGLSPGDKAIEIGAGTGIATQPLIECGLDVTAIEPAAALVMARWLPPVYETAGLSFFGWGVWPGVHRPKWVPRHPLNRPHLRSPGLEGGPIKR
jgi:hypothetical protein